VTARIDKTVVSGVFSLDGQDFDVDNNVWLVGDDDEVLVIDAPHDAAPILEAIGGRRVTAIVLTHGHNDHITAAVALREATGAPIWINPADLMLWERVHPGALPDHAPAGPRTSSSAPQGRSPAQSDRCWVSHSWNSPMWCSEGTRTPPLT
jgi:glyoxylase-like metal-dependent hydrolase (beta-lactamase superfamily II)